MVSETNETLKKIYNEKTDNIICQMPIKAWLPVIKQFIITRPLVTPHINLLDYESSMINIALVVVQIYKKYINETFTLPENTMFVVSCKMSDSMRDILRESEYKDFKVLWNNLKIDLYFKTYGSMDGSVDDQYTPTSLDLKNFEFSEFENFFGVSEE